MHVYVLLERFSTIGQYQRDHSLLFLLFLHDVQEEPVVLPAKVPLMLVNGSSGIAVGIATKIPPHNLREVVQGLIALIENPNIGVPELMEYIPAPDFPTGRERFHQVQTSSQKRKVPFILYHFAETRMFICELKYCLLVFPNTYRWHFSLGRRIAGCI